ncbi:MAG: sensor histidine kinase, partial [Ruminococcus sp.]
VKSYLALEKMRFEDELNIVFDIKAHNFFVPALTVQPLVENAVKHGVGEKPEGGTVRVSSMELPDFFQVEIADDGVGMNFDNEEKDIKVHIGIENVRSRLAFVCGGILIIQSTPGKGTKVIIKIPKEGE